MSEYWESTFLQPFSHFSFFARKKCIFIFAQLFAIVKFGKARTVNSFRFSIRFSFRRLHAWLRVQLRARARSLTKCARSLKLLIYMELARTCDLREREKFVWCTVQNIFSKFRLDIKSSYFCRKSYPSKIHSAQIFIEFKNISYSKGLFIMFIDQYQNV